MEIKLSQKTSNKPWYALGGFVVVVIGIAWLLQSSNELSVTAEDITLLTVEQGNVDLFSQAFGELFSAEERMNLSVSGDFAKS